MSTGGLLGSNMFAYCCNNPVNYFDPSGCCGFSLAGGIKDQLSFAAMCDGGGIGTGTGAGVGVGIGAGAALLPALFDLAQETAEAIISAVSTLEASTQKGTQHVYLLTDPNEDNVVKYVGRTNDPARRLYEHHNDPKHPERAKYEMSVIASGLTIGDAKLVEQALISAFTLAYLENARREIAVGKINSYHRYIGAATEIFAGATEAGLWALLGG